jgi:hypothetical protein
MVERWQWPYAGFEYRVREALVVVEALRVGGAASEGLYAGPGDREAVALQIQLLQQRNVIRIPVIAVAGDVARIAIFDVAGLVSEAIPDRFTPAVLVPRTLHLVSRGRGAPQESRGKLGHVLRITGHGGRGRLRARWPQPGSERGACQRNHRPEEAAAIHRHERAP